MERVYKDEDHQICNIYLNSDIASKSQNYKELKMSNFLSSQSEVPIETEKFITIIQTHMVESVKMNFQGLHKPYLICQSSKINECSNPIYCIAKCNWK